MNDIGQKFGRLTVMAVAEPTARGLVRLLVRCECGVERVVARGDLRSGHTKSCGCLKVDVVRARVTTHGETETAEYRTWSHMIGRCYNPTDKKYPDYGGRGITICQRWRESFTAFLVDMGRRPTPLHTIERMNNHGSYEPGNCRWATPLEQGQNKRNNVYVTLRGDVTITVAQAEKRFGLCNGSILQLTKIRGISHQQAADWFQAHPASRKKPRVMVALWDETVTMAEAERRLGVPANSIGKRAKRFDVTPQEALLWFVGVHEQLVLATPAGNA